jgi:hypothetical protein
MESITLAEVQKMIESINRRKEYMKQYNKTYREKPGKREYFLERKKESYRRKKERMETAVTTTATATELSS